MRWDEVRAQRENADIGRYTRHPPADVAPNDKVLKEICVTGEKSRHVRRVL
jgi:hypothetical protein